MKRVVLGKDEIGTLQEGPDGFALVTWPDGNSSITEVPNLFLVPNAPVQCKRPAAATFKKPATKCAKDAAAKFKQADMLLAQAAHAKQAVLDHHVLYYKNGNRCGIREKQGDKKQIFSFGGTACKASSDQLKEIGMEACKKLAEGWSIEGTWEWAKSQC